MKRCQPPVFATPCLLRNATTCGRFFPPVNGLHGDLRQNCDRRLPPTVFLCLLGQMPLQWLHLVDGRRKRAPNCFSTSFQLEGLLPARQQGLPDTSGNHIHDRMGNQVRTQATQGCQVATFRYQMPDICFSPCQKQNHEVVIDIQQHPNPLEFSVDYKKIH